MNAVRPQITQIATDEFTPEDIENARKGKNGTHSVEAHAFLRKVREGSERIERVLTKSLRNRRWGRSVKGLP